MTPSMILLVLLAFVGLGTGVRVSKGAIERLRTLHPVEIAQFLVGPALMSGIMYSQGNGEWALVVLLAGPVWVAGTVLSNYVWYRKS